MPEKPKRKFIVFYYMNDAWRALSPEEREKEIAKTKELKPEVQKKLGVKEYFHASAYGVSENIVIVFKADSIETSTQYLTDIGLTKRLKNPRTITCISLK